MTASYGVNGFTKDHRAAFERHGIERVYIAYDSDEAGNKAAVKLAEELMQMGVECFRVEFPKGMDANEYALKTQPATQASRRPVESRGVDGQRRAASGPRGRSGDRSRTNRSAAESGGASSRRTGS